MSFIAIPTLAGQAALAAAIDDTDPMPITIAEMVVGDGNGSPVTPLETQTGLVNLRATVPISTSSRDGNKTTFDAILDEDTGGFTIREAGLLDNNGTLLFVASIPATEKLTTAENAFDILTLGLTVVISSTAQVILQPPPGSLVSIADMIRAPFITVDGVLNDPPGSPSDDNCYLVGVSPTGTWIGQAHNLAQWNGTAWVFRAVAPSHVIGVDDPAERYHLERTATGWRRVWLPTTRVDGSDLIFFGTM